MELAGSTAQRERRLSTGGHRAGKAVRRLSKGPGQSARPLDELHKWWRWWRCSPQGGWTQDLPGVGARSRRRNDARWHHRGDRVELKAEIVDPRVRVEHELTPSLYQRGLAIATTVRRRTGGAAWAGTPNDEAIPELRAH